MRRTELCEELCDKWIAIGRATGDADLERATCIIEQVYKKGGLEPPGFVFIADSPMSGAIMAQVLMLWNPKNHDGVEADRIWHNLGLSDEHRALYDRVVEQLKDRNVIGGAIGGTAPHLRERERVRDSIWVDMIGEEEQADGESAIHELSYYASFNLVYQAIHARIQTPVWRQLGYDLRRCMCRSDLMSQMYAMVYGNHDASWLSAYDYYSTLFNGSDNGYEKFRPLMDLAECCGWWAPYRDVVIIQHKPDYILLDDMGRLHNGHGPACSYRDGFSVYAWHGVNIPAEFTGADLEPIVFLSHRDAEVKRAGIEIYGLPKLVSEMGKLLHSDEFGVLWELDLEEPDPRVMVQVKNSTPEPDGTYKTYLLRVPPQMRTAGQAVAWTAGFNDQKEYILTQET